MYLKRGQQKCSKSLRLYSFRIEKVIQGQSFNLISNNAERPIVGIGSGKKVAFKSQEEIEAKAKHILTIIDKRHTNRKSIVLEFTQNPEKLALGAKAGS